MQQRTSVHTITSQSLIVLSYIDCFEHILAPRFRKESTGKYFSLGEGGEEDIVVAVRKPSSMRTDQSWKQEGWHRTKKDIEKPSKQPRSDKSMLRRDTVLPPKKVTYCRRWILRETSNGCFFIFTTN